MYVLCCAVLCFRVLQNSYGTGLTDWDNCSMYGKLALFIFAAWAGQEVSTIKDPSTRCRPCVSMMPQSPTSQALYATCSCARQSHAAVFENSVPRTKVRSQQRYCKAR